MRTTRYARSAGVRIAYQVRGNPRARRPWLALIQGLGFDHTGWDPVVGRLQRHFRLLLIDNRGSGRSDRPTDTFTVADMAQDVVAVLDAAEVATAHVIGASLGGMVAQELAIRYPERVDRLVLVCTTPGWPFAFPMPARSVQLLSQRKTLPREVRLRRNVENALSAQTVEHNPELVERIVAHQQARPADTGAWEAQAAAGGHFVGRLRQARVRADTLVVHGEDDTVVDPRNGRLLALSIPRARLVLLPRAGHLVFWEDPDGFADVVTSFLLEEVSNLGAASPEAPTARATGVEATPHPGAVANADRHASVERAARGVAAGPAGHAEDSKPTGGLRLAHPRRLARRRGLAGRAREVASPRPDLP